MFAQYKTAMLVGLFVGVASVVGSGCPHCQTNAFTTQDRSSSTWASSLRVGPRTPVMSKLRRGSTPNNPFLPRNLHPQQPVLSENDFLGDDYDEDEHRFPWMPVSRPLRPGQHHAKSLQGMDYIREETVGPMSRPLKSRLHGQQDAFSRKAVLGNKRKYKLKKYRQRLGKTRGSFGGRQRIPVLSQMEPPRRTEEESERREEDVQEQTPVRSETRQEENQVPVPELFSGPRAFPKDFVSEAHFDEDFIANEHVVPEDPVLQSGFQTDWFHGENESDRGDAYQGPVLGETPFTQDFGNNAFFDSAAHEDFGDKMTFPEPFADLGPFEHFDDQETFDNDQGFGSLDTYAQPDFLQEGGGLDWLHSSMPGLNLPSSKDIISAFQHPKLTAEAQREACHARNLHTCGKKVITEFTFEPDYPEKCRIREEFLDCMEQQRQQSCEMPEGEHFSREGTKMFRDKIKTLLWSARGCILGYSS